MWVGVGGTPGSGKSFTCELISEFLNKDHSLRTKVISMDGYHYYRHQLDKMDDPALAH